jgi:hypothetical protein
VQRALEECFAQPPLLDYTTDRRKVLASAGFVDILLPTGDSVPNEAARFEEHHIVGVPKNGAIVPRRLVPPEVIRKQQFVHIECIAQAISSRRQSTKATVQLRHHVDPRLVAARSLLN